MRGITLCAVLALSVVGACGQAGERHALHFSGGFDTDPRDHGRPVILVASALGVPADVFREAFSHVRPAPAGSPPEPEQVQRNKQALLSALDPYGVTNERLDEVSDYYRYRPGPGQIWRHHSATGYATVTNGKITAFVITAPGAGYSSPPTVDVEGFGATKADVKVKFSKDLDTNGSIQSITSK